METAARLRVLIASMGLDRHEAAGLFISSKLRDAGMEVLYLGPFQTPESITRAAEEEGIDIIGISCHSWEYKTLVPELIRLLRRRGLRVPILLGGPTISPTDAEQLKKEGVSGVFGAGSRIDDVISLINEKSGDRKRKHDAE